MTDSRKPLAMIPGSEAMTAAGIIKMLEAVTGRPATPEELEEARQWEAAMKSAGSGAREH